MTGVLTERGTFGRTWHRGMTTRREDSLLTGVTHLEAKEWQGLPSNTGRQKKPEESCPRAVSKSTALPAPWFQTPGLQNCETINFGRFRHPVFGALLWGHVSSSSSSSRFPGFSNLLLNSSYFLCPYIFKPFVKSTKHIEHSYFIVSLW